MYRCTLKNQSGFTIPEVILAMVLSTITISGLYQIFRSQQHHYRAQGVSIEAQQSLRSSLFLLTKDIRMARYNPTGISTNEDINTASTFSNITVGIASNLEGHNIFEDINDSDIDYVNEKDRIAFYSNKNANGFIELDNNDSEFPEGDQGEFIAYRLVGNNLQRFNSELFAVNLIVGEGWQTIATDVDALNFVLIDGAGNPTVDPSSANSIELSLLVRSSRTDLDHTDTNNYLNYQGEDICPGCGEDHYHRRLMRTTIRIRNPEGLVVLPST